MSGAIPADLPDALYLWWLGDPKRPSVIDLLSAQIDRPALATQRDAAMKAGR